MVIDIGITEYSAAISPYEVGLAGNRPSAKLLRKKYSGGWFAFPKCSVQQLNVAAGAGFQRMVDKYAEVTTHDPWEDVRLYFQRRASGPLRFPILNTAAMAAASEAIAGWFCETTHPWALLLRPPRITPDLLFVDRNTGRWVLVEVKATARPNLGTKPTTDMTKLLSTLPSIYMLNKGQYTAALVTVQVKNDCSVSLHAIVLEIQ